MKYKRHNLEHPKWVVLQSVGRKNALGLKDVDQMDPEITRLQILVNLSRFWTGFAFLLIQ